VLSPESLHHGKKPHALSEAHRVLKADGYALMYDLVRDMPNAVREDVRARFGGFRFALLRLHSFDAVTRPRSTKIIYCGNILLHDAMNSCILYHNATEIIGRNLSWQQR